MDKVHASDTPVRFGVTISPATVLKFLLAVIFVLSLCGFFVNYNRYVLDGTNARRLYALFNMDWEGNIPTVFSAIELFCSALLLFALCKSENHYGGQWRFHYRSLGIGFLFLSCDEVLKLHERLSDIIARYLHTKSLLTLGTVLLALVSMPLIGVFFWRWLLALPRRIALVMILSAVIYLAGVVGMEVVSIGYAKVQGTKANLMYQMLAIIEETLEMIGIAIFNYALLELLLWQKRQVLKSDDG